MSKMNSIRLFRYSPPEKTAADYTEVEKDQFHEQFRLIAKHHQVRSIIFLAMISCCLALVLFFTTKGATLDSWMTLLFLGYVILCILLFIFVPLLCPACKNRFEVSVNTFCPECGCKLERSGEFFKRPFCPSCKKNLRCGRNRNFDYRCCTHCGVFLDGRGI
jgi:hypothetical protein